MRTFLLLFSTGLIASAQNYTSYNSTAVSRHSFLSSGRHTAPAGSGGFTNALGDSSLIGYWPLNTSVIGTSSVWPTVTEDYSGSGLTATYSHIGSGGATTTTTPGFQGKVGSIAPYFKQVSSQGMLTGSTTLNYTAGLTVSAWIRLNAPGSSGDYIRIFEHKEFKTGFFMGLSCISGAPCSSTLGSRAEVIVNSGGTVDQCYTPISTALKTSTNWSSALNPAPTSQWVMLTATYNGSTAIIYINGVAQSNAGSTCTFTSPGTSVAGIVAIGGCAVGADCTTSAGPMDGQEQDIRLYNRVLVAAEIAAIYAAESPF